MTKKKIKNEDELGNKGEVIIYKTKDGETRLDVNLQNETVWLTQAQMAKLFQKDRKTITEHIQNVFKEGELTEDAVCLYLRRIFLSKDISLTYDSAQIGADFIFKTPLKLFLHGNSHQSNSFLLLAC